MRAKVFYLSIIILGVLASFSLARVLYNSYQSSQYLVDTERKLQALQAENSTLKQETTQASTSTFIDQQAREKLGLVKPGEVLVILPQNQSSAAAKGPSHPQTNRPIWQQWVSLFFGG